MLYQVTYNCDDSYISRMDWRLSRRMTEYTLRCLARSVSENCIDRYSTKDQVLSATEQPTIAKRTVDHVSSLATLLHQANRKMAAFTEVVLVRVGYPFCAQRSYWSRK